MKMVEALNLRLGLSGIVEFRFPVGIAMRIAKTIFLLDEQARVYDVLLKSTRGMTEEESKVRIQDALEAEVDLEIEPFLPGDLVEEVLMKDPEEKIKPGTLLRIQPAVIEAEAEVEGKE